MVYLKDLKTQWPWNKGVKDLSDKEIYTHHVCPNDASKSWRVPILPPMNGYAYTGILLHVYGKDTEYTVPIRLWQTLSLQNGAWTPLVFPLTKKIIEMKEGGLTIDMNHDEPCWGNVEFIGQRFDDIEEDETDSTYIFLNQDKVEWVLNANTRQKTKVIPTIASLLDDVGDWGDIVQAWNK